MKNKEKIVIIGGGASGLMLASLLPPNRAVVIESNSKFGAKLLVSGGGKCNITNQNISTSNYLGNSNFIKSVLARFDQFALLDWLQSRGLKPVLRNNGCYFCTTTSKEIVALLHKEATKQTLLTNQKVTNVEKINGSFVVTTNNQRFKATAVVVASGGLSYPLLGASDIGYKVAQNMGHTLQKTAPALVGLTLQKEQFFLKELSGTSIQNVVIKVGEKKCKGPLLFAHKGISGLGVLDASLYWEKGTIIIDFLPDFTYKELRDSKKILSTILPLPKSFVKLFLEHLDIDDIPFASLSRQDQEKLRQHLHNYTFSPAGTFGYNKAEVTKGGVCTEEIDPCTMQSTQIENLYFLGEVVDVTGEIGGYNLQWAFSSAFVCAKGLG